MPEPELPHPRQTTASKARRRARLRQKQFLLIAGVCVLGCLSILAGGHLSGKWITRTAVARPVQMSHHEAKVLQEAPRYDVFVDGGTPSGIAAALAAARRGATVLLAEPRPHIGGDIVYAMLNMFDVPMGSSKEHPSVGRGIFNEFFTHLGVGFDIKKAESLFVQAIQNEPNIQLRTGTSVSHVFLNQKRLVGVTLHSAGEVNQTIRFGAAVDATNDADLAAKAGSGYYIGRQKAFPDKAMQSVSLLFSVKNVSWPAVRTYVRIRRPMLLSQLEKTKKGATTGIDVIIPPTPKPQTGENATSKPAAPRMVSLRMGGITNNYAWERGSIIKDYRPHGANIIVLSINFGHQSDGSVVLNCLNIVGVNGLSRPSRIAARNEAIAELPYLLAYLRTHMPGFEKAKLDQVAPELYIRETRHIQGLYTLTVEDVRGQKRFTDRIALCSYPLDLHPYNMHDRNPFGPVRYFYTIPLQALIPSAVDGIFVASRSISATYSAAGSARVIPPTMAEGEAVGAASWLCNRRNITPHQLANDPAAIKELQESLRLKGADLGDAVPNARPAVRPRRYW